MNRRSFLKAIIIAPVAVGPLLEQSKVTVAYIRQARTEWVDAEAGVMKFSVEDGMVKDMVNYRGRLLVYCEYSIWELVPAPEGGFTRRLVAIT